MAVDVTLTDVASGYNRSAINDNFTGLATALQDALSRSGDSPNTMLADIDLNSNDLLNAGAVDVASLKVAGVTVTDATYVPDWKGPWVTSASYVVNDIVSEAGSTYICLIAHTSDTFSTDLTANYWELFAKQGGSGAGTGDMLAANNLSDVANAPTSRSNLGLGDVAVQNKASIDITGGTVTGITDLAIADGGTAASTASAAFTNLKQAATDTATGVVEKATSAEGTIPVADKFPDTVVTGEMIANLSTITDGTNGQVLKTDGARGFSFGASSGGGWEIADIHTWSADFASYTLTGLSVYKAVRVRTFLSLVSIAYLHIDARVSAGTWREIVRTPTAIGVGDSTNIDVRIDNFDNNLSVAYKPLLADRSNYGSGITADGTSPIGSGGGTPINGDEAGDFLPTQIHNLAYNEVWDEIRVLPSTGNIEGVNTSERGWIIVEGLL